MHQAGTGGFQGRDFRAQIPKIAFEHRRRKDRTPPAQSVQDILSVHCSKFSFGKIKAVLSYEGVNSRTRKNARPKRQRGIESSTSLAGASGECCTPLAMQAGILT
jgi:hypothetical protein